MVSKRDDDQRDAPRGAPPTRRVGARDADPAPSVGVSPRKHLTHALELARARLEQTEQRLSDLELSLHGRNAELERLRKELAHTSSRLSDSNYSSHRLFEAFCSTLPGKALGGRFEIVQQIGCGGFSYVYQAIDRKTHRDVALKLLRASATPLADVAIHHLAHPNIASVLDSGTAVDGIPFIALELLRGRDLSALLTAQGALSVDQTLHIAHGVSAGLAEAHRWDIVHRDIKPSNVFVARVGTEVVVKILDFGLARVLRSPERDLDLVAGTPGYVAPERVRREPYGPAVDVYSVGVLMLEMLGLSPPSSVTLSADDLLQLRPDLPRGFAQLTARAIAFNPDQRPSAQDLACDLNALLCLPSRLSELLLPGHVLVTSTKDFTLESLDAHDAGCVDTCPHLH